MQFNKISAKDILIFLLLIVAILLAPADAREFNRRNAIKKSTAAKPPQHPTAPPPCDAISAETPCGEKTADNTKFAKKWAMKALKKTRIYTAREDAKDAAGNMRQGFDKKMRELKKDHYGALPIFAVDFGQTQDQLKILKRHPCSKAATTIKKLLLALPAAAPAAQAVLQQKQQLLSCTTPQALNQNFATKTQAFFSGELLQLIFAPEHLKPHKGESQILIHHELLHGQVFWAKHKVTGKKEEISSLAPIKTHTLKDIDNFNRLLTQGDDKIRQFQSLHQKKMHTTLSKAEQRQFNIWEKAMQGCLSYNPSDIPDSPFQEFFGTFNAIQENLPFLEVIYAHMLRPGDTLHNEGIKLSERFAYTFAWLSESARKVFYEKAEESFQLFIGCHQDEKQNDCKTLALQ